MILFLVKPSTVIYEDPLDLNDLRLKNIIKIRDGSSADIGLIGVPFDEGIVAGGGRAGAAECPDAIRKTFKRYGTTYFADYGVDISNLKIVDFGDVEIVKGDINETHKRVTEVVFEILKKGILPVIIGGGDDLSFASIRAISTDNLGGVNVDAHFDVREIKNGIITSGTPYRRVLEELKMAGKRFVEIGNAGNSNSKFYHEYLISKGVKIVSLKDFRMRSWQEIMDEVFAVIGDSAFFSIDIDSVQQAYAPGCSAPAPTGFQPEEVNYMAFRAGKSKSVKLFNLMEISPSYDVDGRTARLGVSILSHFFAGYNLRNI